MDGGLFGDLGRCFFSGKVVDWKGLFLNLLNNWKVQGMMFSYLVYFNVEMIQIPLQDYWKRRIN